MNISVVIPTYNRIDLLRNCLTAVLAQTFPAHEIIVVDDASTDGTTVAIQNEFPQVRLITQTSNQGPAKARNRAIQAAQSPIIAFTDDDCLPPPDWLEKLAAGFQTHPHIAGVSGYQAAADWLIKQNAVARAEVTLYNLSCQKHLFTARLGGYEVPGFGTNNAAYKKEVLVEVNGFDETFPLAAGEDADLKLRISQHHALYYIPLKVEHCREYSIPAQWRLGIRRGIGAFHFESKHASAPSFGRIMLRFGKRTVQFFLDMPRYGFKTTAVIFLTRFSDACGQLIAWKNQN